MYIGSLRALCSPSDKTNNDIVEKFKDKDFDWIMYQLNHTTYSTLFKELSTGSDPNCINSILDWISKYSKTQSQEWLSEQLGKLQHISKLCSWRVSDKSPGEGIFSKTQDKIDKFIASYPQVKPKTVDGDD